MPLLLDGVKVTTTTSGTGDITLGSPATGYNSIADHDEVVDGSLIYGVIEDGNNREIGIYRYNTSGPTLTRIDIHSTLTAGTFNDTNPTPLSLSGGTSFFMSLVTQASIPSDFMMTATITTINSIYGGF